MPFFLNGMILKMEIVRTLNKVYLNKVNASDDALVKAHPHESWLLRSRS